jgi:transcriptional regulator with XRE-family HTH domain
MAASPTVDVRALHAALDAARSAKGLSWRQVAKEIGVSASTISRMTNGLKPDLGAFAAMTTWLRMPAERFYLREGIEGDEEPELLAEIAPLLRARKDLTKEDADYLGDLIQAAARRFRAESDARSE